MYSILVVYDITENEKSVKLYITLYTLFTVFIGIRRTASVYGYESRGGRKTGSIQFQTFMHGVPDFTVPPGLSGVP